MQILRQRVLFSSRKEYRHFLTITSREEETTTLKAHSPHCYTVFNKAETRATRHLKCSGGSQKWIVFKSFFRGKGIRRLVQKVYLVQGAGHYDFRIYIPDDQTGIKVSDGRVRVCLVDVYGALFNPISRRNWIL